MSVLGIKVLSDVEKRIIEITMLDCLDIKACRGHESPVHLLTDLHILIQSLNLPLQLLVEGNAFLQVQN